MRAKKLTKNASRTINSGCSRTLLLPKARYRVVSSSVVLCPPVDGPRVQKFLHTSTSYPSGLRRGETGNYLFRGQPFVRVREVALFSGSENNRPQPGPVSTGVRVTQKKRSPKVCVYLCVAVYRKRKRNGKSDDRNRLTLPDTSISGHCYSSTLCGSARCTQHKSPACRLALSRLWHHQPAWIVGGLATTDDDGSCCNGRLQRLYW